MQRILCTVVAAVLTLLPSGWAAAQPDDAGTSVVGGTRASTQQFPFAVFLTEAATGLQFCGGTLVAADKVVTAAHCFLPDDTPDKIKVVAGRDDKTTTAGVVADVGKFWIHPDYDPDLLRNDIAVITLKKRLPFKPLPLASPSDSRLERPGTDTTALGWGAVSEDGPPSRFLLRATIPVVDDGVCGKHYQPDYHRKTQLCAGVLAGGTDTCQGDSGGPLVAGGKLVGITSFGDGCARKDVPAVYTRVSAFYHVVSLQIRISG